MLAGVTSAVRNVNEIIAPQLIGLSPTDQKAIDEKMVQELDGSRNEWGWSKSKLGANAILAVSMGCRARLRRNAHRMCTLIRAASHEKCSRVQCPR